MLLALTTAHPVFAQTAPPSNGSTTPGPTTPGTPTSPEAQQKAEEHYKKARELYQSGSYREAASELEAARALDPNAKDLVFNLGVVSEKLGRIDDALRYFRLYVQMEGVTPQEKQKAEAAVRRLEGAKREITPPPTTPEPKPEHGRVDAATIVAASLAVIGIGVGAGFGIKALVDKPKSNYVTGSGAGADGTNADLVDAKDRAHTEAIVSDVGFGVGVAAAAVAAYLYFARTKPTPRTGNPGVPATVGAGQGAHAEVSVAPTPGGGALIVQGIF